MTVKPIALYVHIPFCVRKCAYCDFVSFAGQETLIDDYLTALEGEIRQARARYGPLIVDTLYIGGGTPSILNADQLRRLLMSLREGFDLNSCVEATCEMNPGTLDRDKLEALHAGGVNRLSLGGQAFDDRLLRTLGRIHTSDEAIRSVLAAYEAGFDNISVDLMYGLPGQTVPDWERTLGTALTLPLRHMSCYSLIVEEGTPMRRLFNERAALFPDEDTVVAMQKRTTDLLTAGGYERYEISNYARAGYACRHNMTYWRRGDYLGLGVAAHSLMNGERFSNTESLRDYLKGVREISRQVLTTRDIYEETVMLGLRTSEGVEAAILPPDKLNSLVAGGFMRVIGDRACATEQGALVLNALILELV